MKPLRSAGFTIVELLIVVVVIAILASITIVSYNGITQRAATAKLATTARNYAEAFQLYQATYGEFPYIEDNSACLGEPSTYKAENGFAAAECGPSNGDDYAVTLATELKKVMTPLPDASYPPVTIRTGPSQQYQIRGIIFTDDVNSVYFGINGNTCPVGKIVYFSLSNSSLCEIELGLE